MADGQVVFEITADGKQAIANIKDITKAIEKETKKWDDTVDDSTEGAADSWQKAVGKIVGTLSAAGVASILLGWGKAAISAASDLAEVQNVVDVTFGDSASRIEAWAKQAGKQYGLTETAAKRYTSTIGAMLKSQGMADDEIVQTSTDLAGLAADMASFYNLSFDEAFQKIRSGISGETEPLKQLGINMSAANLEAFRLAQGIEKSYSAMSQGEQTALRYQYIMQATADAQGDFARTADGYANASRRMETAMDTIKTKGGQLLLEVVEPLASGLADILEELTTEPEATIFDTFASADDTAGKRASQIKLTADEAYTLAGVLDDLGESTTKTESEQKLWLETCKRLVQTIPGLSSVINAETGEVNGGTQAVRDYVKAWEEGKTKLAMLGALQEKESALSAGFSDLPGLQLDAALAERRVREQKKKLDELRKKYGIDRTDYSLIKVGSADAYGNVTAAEAEWNAEISALRELEKAAKQANTAYNDRAAELEEARIALEEYENTIEELPGDAEAAAKATGEWTDAMKEAGRTAVEASKQALDALAEYVQGVHDATESAVNSVVKGFERITRPTTELEEKRSKLIEQQNALNRSTREGAQEYDRLQSQIDDLNKSLDEYSPKGMQDALQSQLAFMDEYIKNLEKARGLGLSNELLASLSDGSVQSAEYLAQLVASPEAAKKVDELFKQVQEKKKGFTDALTAQKLTVDDTYAAMVETAKKSISEMDLGDEASTALGNTVAGIAQGISSHVPEVRSAVDDVLAQLNRLSGYGINVSLSNFGGILGAAQTSAGQYARFSVNPGTSINYDAIGEMIGSKSGNVYLDGRTVGKVISDQQGASYRALERSGWQQ